MMRLQLLHTDGSRKYLTHAERHAFLAAAARFPRDVHTFCAVGFFGESEKFRAPDRLRIVE